MTLPTLTTALADALRRVEPYLDLVPASAAEQVREALMLYNEAVKKESERG